LFVAVVNACGGGGVGRNQIWKLVFCIENMKDKRKKEKDFFPVGDGRSGGGRE